MKFDDIPDCDFFDALLKELIHISLLLSENPATYYRVLSLHDRLADIVGKSHLRKLRGNSNER